MRVSGLGLILALKICTGIWFERSEGMEAGQYVG